jgi:hypothetical protein
VVEELERKKDMRYFCYYNNEKVFEVLSEDEIIDSFYEDWASNMVKKLNGNTAYFEANYRLPDFIDDWVYENGAWESTDE